MASGFVHAREVTVSAASSLTNAFKDVARSYEAAHPGSKVLLNFGGSGSLLQQLAKGAPVDVFASADIETMDMAVAKGLVSAIGPRDFARNALVLVVPNDSKLTLMRLHDLRQPSVRWIAIGNPASVPVGRYTRHALVAAKLWPTLSAKVITTQNVRHSLDYVARGEVDAGFVYATDAAIMPGKVKVAFEVPLAIAIRYPIAPVSGSANAAEASRFIDHVLSPAGQAILAKYGFRKP
ncbi:MAG: molybdate ABC transporter substrate-binding protein [Thermomonas sp.]